MSHRQTSPGLKRDTFLIGIPFFIDLQYFNYIFSSWLEVLHVSHENSVRLTVKNFTQKKDKNSNVLVQKLFSTDNSFVLLTTN